MYSYVYSNNINPYMVTMQTDNTTQLNPSIDLSLINNKIKEALDQYTSKIEISKTLPNIDEMKQIIKTIVKENINEIFPSDTDPLNVKQQCKAINQQLMVEFNQLKSLVETYQQNQEKLVAQFNTAISERDNKFSSTITGINSILANKANLSDLHSTEQNLVGQNNTFNQKLTNLVDTVALKANLNEVIPLVTEVNKHVAQVQNLVERNTDKKIKEANNEVSGQIAQVQNLVERNTDKKIKEAVGHISDNNNTFTSKITTINSILANKANKSDLHEIEALKANKSDLDYIKLKINNINKRIQKNEQLVAKKFKKHLLKLRKINERFTSIKSDIQNLNNGHQELVNNSLIMGTLFKQLYVEVSGYEATLKTKLEDLEQSFDINNSSLIKNNQNIQQLTTLISNTDQIIQDKFNQINQEIRTIQLNNQVSTSEIEKLKSRIEEIKRVYDTEQGSIKERIDNLEDDKDIFLDAIDISKEDIQTQIKNIQELLDKTNIDIANKKSEVQSDENIQLIATKEQAKILLTTELQQLSNKLSQFK
jgi:hypothetical protein